MNYLEINLKDGLIVVNKQPISIFFMNDFMRDFNHIFSFYYLFSNLTLTAFA